MSSNILDLNESSQTTTNRQVALAQAIQGANYDCPEALNWKWNVVYAGFRCNEGLKKLLWTKVTFDHSKNNAKDVWQYILDKKKDIVANNGDVIILPELIWCQRIDQPPFDVYVGKPDIRPRDVIKCFWEWSSFHSIYIPIDMSHSLHAPALLNYTFDNKKSFESNWEEVQRIKANQNDYISQDDRWKQHIVPHTRWVTMLRNEFAQDFFCMDLYDYDRNNLQGLAISQNATASYFVFSFWADPVMKSKFIGRYGLSLMLEHGL